MNTSLRRLLLTVAAAPAAALAVWTVAVPLAGATPAIRTGGGTGTVGPAAVVGASLLAGLAGWALLAVLERSAARPAPTWTIIALVVLALSLTGPLANATGATAALVLTALHLVTAAVLIPGLVRR